MPTDAPSTTGPDVRDIRLIVADMDGTLLDGSGSVPDTFWPVLDRLRSRGIVFAVASGRQHAALAGIFGDVADELALIAENGAYVVRDGEEVSSSTVDPAVARHTVAVSRELSKRFDIGLVWCGRHAAYVERQDRAFLAEAARFYTRIVCVDDLGEVTDRPLKFAVHDEAPATLGSREALAEALHPFRVVMSSERWMDIMDPAVNKGVAVRALQRSLGVGPDQTMAFGDYLNDLEMLAEATHSFAMDNAHPRVKALARHRAPSNGEHGVIRELCRLLG